MKIAITIVTLFTLVVAPLGYSQTFGTAAGSTSFKSVSAEASSSPVVDLGICFASILEEVEIPSRMDGTLVNLNIRKGDQVQTDQPIGKIDDMLAIKQRDSALMKMEIAQAEAAAPEPLEYAKAKYAFASQRLSSDQRLYQRGSGSAADLEESRLAAREAELAVSKAHHDQKIAIRTAALEKVSVEAAELQLNRHWINAPIGGDVMDVFKNEGEWVAEGEKVARIVRMDKLQVQGSFSALEFNPGELMGKPVTVLMEIARGEVAQFNGKIYAISLDQTATRRYRVWAEVENRQHNGQWILRPQAEVKMQAQLDEVPAAVPGDN